MFRLKLSCCSAKLYNNQSCVCVLQRAMIRYMSRLKTLPSFKTTKKSKQTLNYSSINSFDVSQKSKNDHNNKVRENVVCAIINRSVPPEYFSCSPRWKKLKTSVEEYVSDLVGEYNTIECKLMGGRNNKHDFDLILNGGDKTFKIELKFNAQEIEDTPQIISPMKPSQYLSMSYEEYYYENYLGKLCENKPPKEVYLSQIHSTKPKCVADIQEKYKRGYKPNNTQEDYEFHMKCKEISKESLYNFITIADLDIKKFSSYLKTSQIGKIYMLYKNSQFYKDIPTDDDYELVSYVKDPTYSRYIATSKTGRELKILLRWKNGNGVAFPAFQIS
jgi:hypothetical protein